MPRLPANAKTWMRWIMLIPLALSFLWFYLLEKNLTVPKHLMHARLDDYIPFTPVFVIPYVLWYFYAYLPIVFLFFKSRREFVRAAAFFASGMAIACAVYTFFPNGQALRPALYEGGGSLVHLIGLIYSVDSPVNSAPSIHVIFSVAAHAAIIRYNNRRSQIPWVNVLSAILALLCILSTVFIKQHSVIDLVAGLILSGLLYFFIYGIDALRVRRAPVGKVYRHRRDNGRLQSS